MKKLLFVCALISSLAALAPARAQDQFSLIVAPARYNVIQVLFDVIERNPAVLVSYQGEATTENPALHVWDGSTWNPIGVHELQELGFLQRSPARAVLVGDDALLPAVVRDSLSWLPEVVYVRDLTNAGLLNEFGRIYNWTGREYRWYANRYNLDLEDEAAPARKTSWYEQAGPRPKNQTRARETYQPAPAPQPQAQLEPVEPISYPAPEPVVLDLPAPEPVQTLREAPEPAPEPITIPSVEARPAVPADIAVRPPASSEPSKPATLDEFIKTLEAERAKSSEPFPIK